MSRRSPGKRESLDSLTTRIKYFDADLEFQIIKQPVYTLRMYFSCEDQIREAREVTKSFGSQRDISVCERINVVKTVALSKVIFIRRYIETPPNFSKEVGTKWFSTKKTTLITF